MMPEVNIYLLRHSSVIRGCLVRSKRTYTVKWGGLSKEMGAGREQRSWQWRPCTFCLCVLKDYMDYQRVEKQQLIRNHLQIYSRIIYRGKLELDLYSSLYLVPRLLWRLQWYWVSTKSSLRKILLIWAAPSLHCVQYHRYDMWRQACSQILISQTSQKLTNTICGSFYCKLPQHVKFISVISRALCHKASLHHGSHFQMSLV